MFALKTGPAVGLCSFIGPTKTRQPLFNPVYVFTGFGAIFSNPDYTASRSCRVQLSTVSLVVGDVLQ